MSRIRTNLITNRMANGAPTVSNGLVISGVTTVTTLDLNGDIDVDGHTNLDNLSVVGVATFSSVVNANGNIGIGTNNPTKLLELFGTDPTIKLMDSSGDAYALIEGDSADQGSIRFRADPLAAGASTHIRFDVDGTEKLRLTSAGRVGIDRTSPNTMLDIKVPPLDTATITTTNCLQLGMLLTAGGTGSNTDGHIYNGLAVGDGYAGLYGKDGGSSAATDLEFFTGSSSAVAGRMRIQDDGKIIMGGNVSQSINRNVSITAPTGNSQDIVIGLQPTNSSGGYNPEVYIGATADGTYGAAIYFYTRNTSGTRAERLRITSDGHTLFSGLTTKNDPRNANGITVKSTAGVSFQNYGSNGSRNWRIRPDDQSRWGDLDFSVSPTANSATDWPDAAADKVLTLGYDGTVTKPRQPLFVAQKSAAITGAGYVICNTVIENVGSYYNSSDGKFTAPVAGYYWFCMKINAYKRIDFFLRRNGSNSGSANREIGQFNTSNQDGWYSHNLVRIFELAENDYVQCWVNSITQNSDPGEWITFQGYLLQ